MDSRTPAPQTTRPPDHSTLPGPHPDLCDCQTAQVQKVIDLLKIFFKSLRHFFPESPDWLDQLPDTRYQPMVEYHSHFVVTFKEGRTPDLWREFQALLKLCPERKRTATLPDKPRRVYRWVEHLPYVDSQKRAWNLGAIVCEETSPTGSSR